MSHKTKAGHDMLDGNENEPRSAAESYASATAASNLRFEAHRVGAADAIGAAGMNPYRTGLALMRLQSEWDRASKPRPPTRLAVEALAVTYRTEPSTIDGDLHCGPRRPQPNPNAGLVEQLRQGRIVYRKPLDVAREEADRMHFHELGILFSHLKTLPEIRAELERWIGPPHAARLVGDVLGWWLEPRCLTCRGSGKIIITGTGGRSSGKVCWACRLSPNPGERPLPHSGIGRMLLSHIRSCVGAAGKDQGTKEHRTPDNEFAREITKKHDQVAKLRRADEEAKGETEESRAKDAAHFGKAMTRKRLDRGGS